MTEAERKHADAAANTASLLVDHLTEAGLPTLATVADDLLTRIEDVLEGDSLLPGDFT